MAFTVSFILVALQCHQISLEFIVRLGATRLAACASLA